MDKKDWDRFDLESYINKFTENQRDSVFAQVMEAELLAKVFDTTEGKLILKDAVDMITSKVMEIVNLSISDKYNNADSLDLIMKAALQINVVRNIMYRWATTLVTGKEHKEKIKKMKKGKE